MDDEVEDRVLYQAFASNMKFLSKCAVGLPLNSAPFSYLWRILRLSVLRPEFAIFAALVVIVYFYLQSINGWSRSLFSKFTFSLDRPSLRFSVTDGDRLSWEIKEENVSAFAVQGRRQNMEDRFVIHEDINNTGISLFAVFDGHGGEFAANYARDHLIKSLNEKLIEVKKLQLSRQQNADMDTYEGRKYSEGKVNENVPTVEVLNTSKEKRASFKKTVSTTDECTKKGNVSITDAELLKKLESLQRPITREVRYRETQALPKIPLTSYLDSSKFSGINYGKIITDEVIRTDKLLVEAAKKTMDVAGTTALIALLEGDHLVVANVGDSRGVMCDSRGVAIPLSFDHKPQQIKERNRIRDSGGFISFNGVWRVAGILATSRALGDYPLKDKNLVIPDPDILTFNLSDHKPQFVLLASDGLWDTFSNDEAVAYVKERLNEPHFGAKSITLQSYYRGSLDNITVMIINFKNRSWASYSSKRN